MYYINPIDGDVNSNLQASMRQKHLQRTGDAHSDYCFDSEEEAKNAEPPTIADLQAKIEELEEELDTKEPSPVENPNDMDYMEPEDDENPEEESSNSGMELEL